MDEKKNLGILGIVGSPRRGGNTEVLVDEALAGAKEAGLSTEKIILSNHLISPCNACNACIKNGICIHDDGFNLILEKMKSCDIWIFGTPIYWWGPTAQFKVFVDRWYGVEQSIFTNKKIILIIPFGGGSTSYARHTVGMFEDIIPYQSAELVETILAPGMGKKGIVREDPKLLKRARLAWKKAQF